MDEATKAAMISKMKVLTSATAEQPPQHAATCGISSSQALPLRPATGVFDLDRNILGARTPT